MTITIATLLALTLPQRKALAAALIGYAHGSQSFKVDHGFTPQVAAMVAGQLLGEKPLELVTDVNRLLALVALVPAMPYTVPEQARERGTYLRALCKLGLVAEPTNESLERLHQHTRQSDTDTAVAAIMNPAPKDPRPYNYTDRGVDVRLHDHTSTSRMFWSPRINSYVMAWSPRGDFTTPDGRRVNLVSVNGIGEIRWTVQRWQIDIALRDETSEWWDRVDGDGKESLAAARYFGLVPNRTKTIPEQNHTVDLCVESPTGTVLTTFEDGAKPLTCTLDSGHATDHMATSRPKDGRETIYAEWRHAVRCGNGRKCRHHATGAGRHWSCGPDAYEPSHGSDDQKVVGEQEAVAEDGDVECTGCGKRYWSGEGHPKLVLCRGCWNLPPGNRPRAPTATTPQDLSHEPDLDFTSAPLPKGYKPPPSSGQRFPGSTPGLDEGSIDAVTFPPDHGPWEG